LLRKRGIYKPEPGWLKFMTKVCIALLALGLVLWYGMGLERDWLLNRGWVRIIHLSWLVALGAGVYFAVLGILGFRINDFARRGAN
jgi:putative peptidoglycan lipid II flippase